MTRSWSRSIKLACAIALALAAPASAQAPADPRPPLMVMGTVPIYWGEAADFSDLLNGGGDPHWARALLERGFVLVPLDTLDPAQLAANGTHLLMAQPRTLSAAENVALDNWVRGGGHVLLFADPLMTGESRFGIGDRRRPQDVALLSPLLTHWGLDLQFDDDQLLGVVSGNAGVAQLPVNVPGRLAALPGGSCVALGDGLAARCALGAGEALVVADAAVLDHAGPWPGAKAGLAALLESIFPGAAEHLGDFGESPDQLDVNGGILPFSDSAGPPAEMSHDP
ncbi:MAG: ABC transporter [Pseudomonadota bacterium]